MSSDDADRLEAAWRWLIKHHDGVTQQDIVDLENAARADERARVVREIVAYLTSDKIPGEGGSDV